MVLQVLCSFSKFQTELWLFLVLLLGPDGSRFLSVLSNAGVHKATNRTSWFSSALLFSVSLLVQVLDLLSVVLQTKVLQSCADLVLRGLLVLVLLEIDTVKVDTVL